MLRRRDSNGNQGRNQCSAAAIGFGLWPHFEVLSLPFLRVAFGMSSAEPELKRQAESCGMRLPVNAG